MRGGRDGRPGIRQGRVLFNSSACFRQGVICVRNMMLRVLKQDVELQTGMTLGKYYCQGGCWELNLATAERYWPTNAWVKWKMGSILCTASFHGFLHCFVQWMDVDSIFPESFDERSKSYPCSTITINRFGGPDLATAFILGAAGLWLSKIAEVHGWTMYRVCIYGGVREKRKKTDPKRSTTGTVTIRIIYRSCVSAWRVRRVTEGHATNPTTVVEISTTSTKWLLHAPEWLCGFQNINFECWLECCCTHS